MRDEGSPVPTLLYCCKHLMYFDLEDYHPDISPVGQAISWREGVLLSIIAHLMMVILILVAPRWFPWLTEPRRVQVVARQGPRDPNPARSKGLGAGTLTFRPSLSSARVLRYRHERQHP